MTRKLCVKNHKINIKTIIVPKLLPHTKKVTKFECRFSQANMVTLHMFAFITSIVISFKGPFKMCILALTL